MSLEQDLQRAIEGEVRFDTAARAIYAHDASNYRQVPIGVVLPNSVEDIVRVMATCRAHGVPVLARGGGTSLAGQCVNRAVVIDSSKYLNRVLAIDAERRRVRIEPGLILDDLRAQLAPHGLTFGPDPSTHNHCTFGGMLGNNSCGVHSVMAEFYGPGARTSDHVESLEILTYDGLRLQVGRTPPDELDRLVHAGGRVGEIYAALARLRDRYGAQIRAHYAPMPRRVSGYALDQLLLENDFHVARALVGTESTCVTILGATLEVYPAMPHRALVLLGYPDVFVAGDHVPQIRAYRPVGLEAIDHRLFEDIKRARLHSRDLSLLPGGRAWLLVELGASTREEADAQARHLMDALARERNAPAMKLFEDPEEEHAVWKIREAGLGATAYIPGRPDAYEGWEDSAVPPEQLGAYLRGFRALLDRYDYDTALYGHFGQGCVHCRINFDLGSPEGIDKYRRFTAEAADLVVKHGGSLSGEHGDGQSRGELLVKQYGPDLVEAFREFKRIWDPMDRMNPGKIVDGASRTDHLKLAIYHPPEVHTHLHPADDGGDFRHAALRCVGIGECRREHGGTMCPSYMVTRDEQHTTRGRARALFEMMQGDLIQDGWASDAVKSTLDLCLACKGCKGDCPVHVDVATYKAEFLSHYYEHHRRPRHAYAFGWIHRWAYLASFVPELANLVTQTPGLRQLAAWLVGAPPARPIPRFATHVFTRRFARRRGRNGRARGERVLLWPDTFNNYFFPETLDAAVAVLEDAGFAVDIPRERLCCGRPLYDYGMLDEAERLWRRNLEALADDIARGTPIIGLEPSCVAAFRDELPSLFPRDVLARGLAEQTRTLSEFLAARRYQPPPLHARAIVQGHCHHKAVLDFGAERQLLAAMELDLALPDSGCCGLAGSFGFEAGHYDISMAIGERAIFPAVRAEPDSTLVLADGFSCREQIQHGTGRYAYHVAEVIAAALDIAGEDRRRSSSSLRHRTTGEPAGAEQRPTQ